MLIATVEWVGRQRPMLMGSRPNAAASVSTTSSYQAGPRQENVAQEFVEWPVPPVQSGGQDWCFELFTSPALRLDESGRAVVASSARRVAASTLPTAPALTLLAVKPEPYRLQIAGYVDSSAGLLATFISPVSGKTWVVKEGHHFADLDLKLLKLERAGTPAPGVIDDTFPGEAAIAVLHDAKDRQNVVLDSRETRVTDRGIAVVEVAGADERARELRAGDTIAVEEWVIRVERILTDPAELVVSCIRPGAETGEMQVLYPATGSSAPEVGTHFALEQSSADSTHFPSSP
ncbi:MAG TPA: hypothetical protein VHS96_03885, partial [Bacteroidia bacterium]|nr:hypothetical protein [Bacteroidia bacterium]